MTATIQVRFEDILSGRAWIAIPPAARVALCERAGAPWSTRPGARLSPLQREALSRPEAVKVIHGGSGVGKSVTAACDLLPDLLIPGRQLAFAASRYEQVSSEFGYLVQGLRRLFGPVAKQAFSRLVCRSQMAYHDFDAHAVWGARAVGLSTDSEEGGVFLGKQLDRVALCEASQISHTILEYRIFRSLDRARSGAPYETGYLTAFTTPDGYEGAAAHLWDAALRRTGNDPSRLHYGRVPFAESTWLREATVLENPDYDVASFEARRATMTKEAFEEQYLGKMTFRSGAIFTELDPSIHVRPLPGAEKIRRMRLGLGIDTGASFAAVLYGVAHHMGTKERWVLGEVQTEKLVTSESVELLRQMVTHTLAPALGVPCDPDKSFPAILDRLDCVAIDPASQHKYDLTEMLWPLDGPVQGGLVFPDLVLEKSIDAIRTWLKSRELLLAEDTPVLLDQMTRYRWKTMRAPTVRSRMGLSPPLVTLPKKGWDHLIDALRNVACALEDLDAPSSPLILTRSESIRRARLDRVWQPLRTDLARGEERGGIPV